MLLVPFLAGCAQEPCADEIPVAGPGDERPVEFDFMWPDDTQTRGFSGAVKTRFQNGDVIHVLGTFTTRELQEDGTFEMGEMIRYGALRYDGKNWGKVDGSNLTWPSVSLSGTFRAFYVSGSNGVLTDLTETPVYSLSEDATPTGDPLEAQSDVVFYGHAVALTFKHICAYLTLIDLEPMVASEYWFRRDGVESFNNAFKLVLGKDAEGDPASLDIEFCRQGNPDFKNLVYIAAKAEESKVFDELGNEKTITRASYFLEPGDYETFSLCYPANVTEGTWYDYLKYDYNNIPTQVGGVGVENVYPKLEAGTTYTLMITKSPGITMETPPQAGGWDPNGWYADVDVEQFLKSIYEKKRYTGRDDEGNEIVILEETATGTRLNYNVDFHNTSYADFEDQGFVPNIIEGNDFDGGQHYIKNLSDPLFRYNYGTIRNLGIRDVRIEAVSYEHIYSEDSNLDMSRHGALCMWNRPAATIENVHVSNVSMTVYIRSAISAEADGSEAHNVGCVLGSNSGKVSDAALSGRFELKVLNETDPETGQLQPVNARVLIGGFVGQNAAGGSIYDIFPLESDLNLLITNNCTGEIGSYSVGGVAGESSGVITGAILSDVTIRADESQGVTSYIGGIAGQLAVSESTLSTASINSCIVNGSVTAGSVLLHQDLTSASYIGGIAGADLDVTVLDCRVAVSVDGAKEKAVEGALYATGGAFGRIRSATTEIENVISYGSSLDGPQADDGKQYIGNFAGIVPQGQTWDDYAARNIIFRRFGEYRDIGIALDSSNNE